MTRQCPVPYVPVTAAGEPDNSSQLSGTDAVILGLTLWHWSLGHSGLRWHRCGVCSDQLGGE